jgi:site-specific recombinase XerD
MVTKVNKYMTISLEKGIELYLSTLATEGKSPRYILWLKDRLRYFTNFIRRTYGEDFSLPDLNVENGREYLRELMGRDEKYPIHPMSKPRSGKLAIQYIHGCGRAVRSFSSWAAEEGYLEENVMRRLKLPPLPKTLPEPLSEEQIRKVLSVSLDNTLERLRNFSMMMLFLDTGLRLSELINLRLSRVDLAQGEMTILGKGSKERKVPIGSQAKKALVDYLSRERPEPDNPQDADRVYLSADGRPITQETVEKVFQRIKKVADLPRFHPHICRHTFSVRYLVNGGDVFSLQKILGHSSLEMTRKYVNLASGDVKDKHRRFSPMDNLNYRAGMRGRPKHHPG